MGLAVGRVPANTTQSKAVLLWKDCLRKMRKDRWLQIVLEHKPKCQICRGRVKGSQGGGGGTAREARTKLHSQAKKPGQLHSQELGTLQLVPVLCWALRTEKVGLTTMGFGDREAHSVMIIQGDVCSN